MGKYPYNTVLSRRQIDRIIDKAFKVRYLYLILRLTW